MNSLVLIAMLLWVRPAHAHGGQLLRQWTLDPWLLSALAMTSLLYFRGARAMRQGAQRTPRRLEDAAFVLAILSLVVALVSPLDALSDLSFAAHMTQHELLMLLAAPLVVLARPLPTYLCALPPSLRNASAAALRHPRAVSGFRLLTAPALAMLLHALVRWLWHIPALFEAALASEWVHGVQHGTFFFTALLFWWGLLQGRYGRAGYGMAFVFVLLTAMHTGALGALLSFSEQSWYPSYTTRSPGGFDAVRDQQLAGLIMWVGAGVWMMLLALALFLAWLGEARRRVARGSVALMMRERGELP